MQIKSLEIINIGMIEKEVIKFDKALNLFYGDVRQGKTTILNAIKWCFGGSFPDDIIKHGEKKASIGLYFDKGEIVRKFRKDKYGVTKAEKIEFINSDGEEVGKPVDEIKKFLNPFLLNQDHLKDMNEPDRKRFFVELFGIDTETVDKELTALESDASTLRAQVKAYGDISEVKVESVNIEILTEEKELIVKEYEDNYILIEQLNDKARKRNDTRVRGAALIKDLKEQIETNEKWLNENPDLPVEKMPSLPDTAEIDNKIGEGREQNVKYEQYLTDKSQASLKAQDQDELTEKESKIRDLRQDRASLLSSVNDKCDIKGLRFDDNGNPEYEKTTAGMLSTSQVMRLSSELTKLYPEGFSLELIDRGESIGQEIFLFVDRAEAEKKTILATIVGEKPADVPENIGVFVVEDGKIK